MNDRLRVTTLSLCLTIMLALQVGAQTTKTSKSKVDVKKTEITFKSQDGLKLTADLYMGHKDMNVPFIVLCHQAGWSRGEYNEIAPKLVKMGFHCMALDQRSGGQVNGVNNKSFARARDKKLGTTYLDARQDIVAALKYAKKNYAKGKLLVWGSSYSSALVLQIGGSEPKLADGILSFAPGEYFGRFGKSDSWIRDAAKKIKVPVFLTGSQAETKGQVKQIADVMAKHKALHFFKPETRGNHGSRALFERFADHKAYWKSVTQFLDKHFPRKMSAKKKAAKSRPARKQ